MGPRSTRLQVSRVQDHGTQTLSQVHSSAVCRDLGTAATAAARLVHELGVHVELLDRKRRHVHVELVEFDLDRAAEQHRPTASSATTANAVTHRRSQTDPEEQESSASRNQ